MSEIINQLGSHFLPPNVSDADTDPGENEPVECVTCGKEFDPGPHVLIEDAFCGNKCRLIRAEEERDDARRAARRYKAALELIANLNTTCAVSREIAKAALKPTAAEGVS